MIRIVSFKICPFVQRVTALLEAKAYPMRSATSASATSRSGSSTSPPLARCRCWSPKMATALFESDAITEYVTRSPRRFSPACPRRQRALNRAWSYQASKHYLVQCSAMQSADKGIWEERSAKLARPLRRQRSSWAAARFFAGEALGNVDIAWLPLLHRAAIVAERSGHDMLADYPKVKAWQQALAATGIPQSPCRKTFCRSFRIFTWLSHLAGPRRQPE